MKYRPKKAPSPDFSVLRRVILRQGKPERVPFFELFADIEVMEAIINKPIRGILDSPERRDRELAISHRGGA